MTDVRYLGSAHWTRTVLDDNGKFKEFEIIAPGEVFSAEGDVATRLLQGPRYNRLFVQAGGPEDPNSEGYQNVREIGSGGMYVSQDVGRELGSTTPDGRVIFRTEDDNEESFPVAPPNVGPQSDNAELFENDAIDAAGQEAKDKARASRSSKSSGAGQPGSGPKPTSSSGSPSRPSGEKS